MLRATVDRKKKRRGFLSTNKMIIFGGISILLIIVYGAILLFADKSTYA